MQLKNPTNLLTSVKGISIPDVKLNPLAMEKNKANTPEDKKNTPEDKKNTPVVEAVVKAANTAVNGSSKNADKVAALLKNRSVINAAKKLVEELNHSAPSSPIGASPENPTTNSQKGGLRKTRSKAKKTRSTRRR